MCQHTFLNMNTDVCVHIIYIYTLIITLQYIIIIIIIIIIYSGNVSVQYHTRFLFAEYGIWISGRLPTLRAVVLSDNFRSLQENFEIVL
jgi:hypothetical protein